MPQGAPYIHSGDPAYAPPVLRAPSPSSSIGTEYPPDESTQAEEFMTEDDFVKKLKLNHPWITEAWSWRDPLLPKPKDAAQEAQMHMAVLELLRSAVKRVKDDELFEQRLMRGSLAITDQRQAPSGDIDSIMRSMMNLSPNSATNEPSTSEARSDPQPPYTPIMMNGGLPSAADLSFDPPSFPPIEPMGPPPLPAFLDLGPNTDMNPMMTSTPGRRSTRLRTNTRRP